MSCFILYLYWRVLTILFERMDNVLHHTQTHRETNSIIYGKQHLQYVSNNARNLRNRDMLTLPEHPASFTCWKSTRVNLICQTQSFDFALGFGFEHGLVCLFYMFCHCYIIVATLAIVNLHFVKCCSNSLLSSSYHY